VVVAVQDISLLQLLVVLAVAVVEVQQRVVQQEQLTKVMLVVQGVIRFPLRVTVLEVVVVLAR
jgi:hypothetical protein